MKCPSCGSSRDYSFIDDACYRCGYGNTVKTPMGCYVHQRELASIKTFEGSSQHKTATTNQISSSPIVNKL